MTDQTEKTRIQPLDVPSMSEIVQNIGAAIGITIAAGVGIYWGWSKLRGWL